MRRESMMHKILDTQIANLKKGYMLVEIIIVEPEEGSFDMGEIKLMSTSEYNAQKFIEMPFIDFNLCKMPEGNEYLRPIVLKEDFDNWK